MSSNGYVFTTRRAVLAKLTPLEPEFLLSAVRLLAERNGWMASHRSRAAKLVAKLAEGSPSAEDLAEATALMKPYARTVSRILREREIAKGAPELAAKAAVFGVLRPASPAPDTREVVQSSVASPSVADTPAVEVPVVAPKRRGRPPGSKNKKPRSESEPKRRRHS